VEVVIFGPEGTLVKTLTNDVMDEGFKEVTWDGKDVQGNSVSSGVYFYRLKAGKKVLTRKMVLLK
jgi:flagellar hook assembly protein FlgD